MTLLYYFIVNKVHSLMRTRNWNAAVVRVRKEKGVGVVTVHHVTEVQIDVGEAEVAKKSEVANGMAKIGKTVARKDIVIVQKGVKAVEIETVVKDPEEIDSTIHVAMYAVHTQCQSQWGNL